MDKLWRFSDQGKRCLQTACHAFTSVMFCMLTHGFFLSFLYETFGRGARGRGVSRFSTCPKLFSAKVRPGTHLFYHKYPDTLKAIREQPGSRENRIMVLRWSAQKSGYANLCCQESPVQEAIGLGGKGMFTRAIWSSEHFQTVLPTCGWQLYMSVSLLLVFGVVVAVCLLQIARVRALTSQMSAVRARQKGVRYFIWLHLLLGCAAMLYLLDLLMLNKSDGRLEVAFQAAPQLLSLYVVSSLVTQWRLLTVALQVSDSRRRDIYRMQYAYMAMVLAWLVCACLLVGLSDEEKRTMVVVASVGCMLIDVMTGLFFHSCAEDIIAQLVVANSPSQRTRSYSRAKLVMLSLKPSHRPIVRVTDRIRSAGRLMLPTYLCLALLNLVAAISIALGWRQGYGIVSYYLWLLAQAVVLSTVVFLYKSTVETYRGMWQQHKLGLQTTQSSKFREALPIVRQPRLTRPELPSPLDRELRTPPTATEQKHSEGITKYVYAHVKTC
eukprot:g57230.t1